MNTSSRLWTGVPFAAAAWFEFTSSLMKYVDDVEIYFTGADGLAHVRSASRLGYSDMGANRKRIEMIRGKLAN